MNGIVMNKEPWGESDVWVKTYDM